MRTRKVFGGVVFLTALFVSSTFLFAQTPASFNANAGVGTRRALVVCAPRCADDSFVDLPAVVNDGKLMEEYLLESGFLPENIRVLSENRDGAPTRRAILKELNRIVDECGPNDYLVVMLTGHGRHDMINDKDYFVSCDAKADVWDSYVPMEAVDAALERCSARFKWLLADACRTASKGLSDEGFAKYNAASGYIAMYSCSVGEVSLFTDDMRHSLFVYRLFEGLNGKAEHKNGRVSLFAAYEYARDKVKGKQTPRISVCEAGDCVLYENKEWIEADAHYARSLELKNNFEFQEAYRELVFACGYDVPWRDRYAEEAGNVFRLIKMTEPSVPEEIAQERMLARKGVEEPKEVETAQDANERATVGEKSAFRQRRPLSERLSAERPIVPVRR